MTQKSGKYLYIPHSIGGGFDAQIQHLVTLILVALSMQRIPIITKEFSSKAHRLDKSDKNMPIDWERYFNLSKTEIFKVAHHKVIERVSDTLLYIYEQDVDFSLYSKNQIRYIDYTQASDEENEKYHIVCMLNPKYISGQKKIPKLGERLDSWLSPIPTLDYFITLSPSKLVNNLTDVVLNYFGTTRQDMKFLSSIMYELPGVRHANMKLHYEDLNYYACMHVRYGGTSKAAREMISKSKKLGKYVERIVKLVYERNDEDMPLYIMSNIMDTSYFDFLRPKYKVYGYTDFKELKELVSHRDEIDHNLLYAIESNIMRHAVVRVLSFNRDRFVFEYPWLNTTSTFENIF